MTDSKPKTDTLPQRLCSEVQLFDLCDLDSCSYKSGRFCTDNTLVGRFEKIAEDELRTPERYVSENINDDETADSYDDDDNELAMDDFESGEDDGCEDED